MADESSNNNNILNTKVIIFAVALLVLAALGSSLTTYLFFGRALVQPAPKVVVAEKFGPTYPIGEFTANLADKDVRRYVQTTIVFELNEEKTTEEISQRNPQIRDAIYSILSSYRRDDILDEQGKIRLREEIMNKVNGFLEKGRVKNVYFTQFVVQ